jgi:hypothetical protein
MASDDFEKLIKRRMIERIESEIGLTDDPNLIQILEDSNLKSKIKQYLCNVLMPQYDKLNARNVIKDIQEIASSSKWYNRDTFWGIKNLEFNINTQYNRMYNKIQTEEFGMKYFIYQGG